VVVVDEGDLPVAHVDVARHLHEGRLGRRDDAEGLGDRASFAPDHVIEEIRRPRLIARQDGLGELVE